MTRMNYVLVHYFVILGGDGCHGFITRGHEQHSSATFAPFIPHSVGTNLLILVIESLSFQTMDRAANSISLPHPVHHRNLRCSDAEEYADLNALRKILTQAMIPRFVLGSFLGIVMTCYECYWSAAATFGLVLVNLIALPVLWLTKYTSFARDFATHGTCVCLLGVLWAFGGGPGSAGTIALAYMEQIQHRVEAPSSRASAWWVAGIVVCSLALSIVERTVDPQYVTPQQARLPTTWYAIFFWFGTNWPGIMLYVVLSQLMDELSKSRRLLEASKVEAERLNRELLQQQHRYLHWTLSLFLTESQTTQRMCQPGLKVPQPQQPCHRQTAVTAPVWM